MKLKIVKPALFVLFMGTALTAAISLSSFKNNDSGKGCEVYGKIKFVDYGEDYKVKYVDYGEDIKVKIVDYGADSKGEWDKVDSGEKYKIKEVDYGEDFKVKLVEYGEGCN